MTSATPRRSVTIPAQTGHLAEVRSFVREATAAFGAPGLVADDLVQAVDEAVCNVILHGYRGFSGEIEVGAEARDGRIEIRILDRASASFDPTTSPAPDVAAPPLARKPGGMGIHLVRDGTDSVHHRARADSGNELLLVRRLDGAPGEG